MHTPLDRPSVPAGGCCSTGPPITFSASEAGMIAHTSIFSFAPDPEPEPEPVVADDVDGSAAVEPELLPHAASVPAAVTATAAILTVGRMATDSSGFKDRPDHGTRVRIAGRGPVPYCAPGGTDDGPRAPLAQERDPRTAGGSRAAPDPPHARLGRRPPRRATRDVRRPSSPG